MTPIYSADILKLLERLKSREIYSAQGGFGSFLTIDVGNVVQDRTSSAKLEPARELHVWIYLCDWTLFDPSDENVLDSSMPRASYARVLSHLTNSSILSIHELRRGSVEIRLSGGHRLALDFNADEYGQDDEMLILYFFGCEPIAYTASSGFTTE